MTIKKMLPLFHKLFGMLFADMKKSGMNDKQVDWYIDTLATLMSISIMAVSYKHLTLPTTPYV